MTTNNDPRAIASCACCRKCRHVQPMSDEDPPRVLEGQWKPCESCGEPVTSSRLPE